MKRVKIGHIALYVALTHYWEPLYFRPASFSYQWIKESLFLTDRLLKPPPPTPAPPPSLSLSLSLSLCTDIRHLK